MILSDSECHKDDSYGLERSLVKNFDCDLQRPVCLYDFTLKTLVLDFQVFRIKDYKSYSQNENIIQDYFDDNYTRPKIVKRKEVPIYHGYHICK